MALAHLGTEAIVQRNVHSSVIDGLVLSGLRPTFLAPEIDDELGVAHCLAPAALEAALDAKPDAVAVFAVSPTYFGAVADIAGLAEVAHARDVPLVVDESWGAHLAFSDLLPANALACGADVVLNSVHKLGGSMTQSAILHLGADESHPDGRIDGAIVDRSVTLTESTSPSAILTASLDAARRQNAVTGGALLAETIASLNQPPARGPRRSPASTCSARRSRRRRASSPGTRCGSRSTSAGPATTGNRIAKFMRENARHLVRALRGERRRRRVRNRRERRRDRTAAHRRPRDAVDAAPHRDRRAEGPVRTAASVGPDGDDSARGLPRPPGDGTVRARPRAGSPPSRSPPTHRASRTCSPASGSAARRSTSSPTRSPTADRSAAPATGPWARSGW